MNSQVVTDNITNEGENGFDFNEWIISNGLEEVRELFVKHEANKLLSLSLDSAELQSLMSDPVLFSRPQFISKIMSAIHNISSMKIIKVIIHPKEQNVVESITKYLNLLKTMEKEIECLNIEYPKSIERIQQDKYQQIESLQTKINCLFHNISQCLNNRKKELFQDIERIKNKIKENEYVTEVTFDDISDDEDEDDSYSDNNDEIEFYDEDQDEKEIDSNTICTKRIENLRNYLIENQKKYESLTSNNDDRMNRQKAIILMGKMIKRRFKENKKIINKHIKYMKYKIDKNKQIVVDIDFIQKGNELNNIINKIHKFGAISNKVFNSLQEKEKKGKDQDDDVEVRYHRLNEQLVAIQRENEKLVSLFKTSLDFGYLSSMYWYQQNINDEEKDDKQTIINSKNKSYCKVIGNNVDSTCNDIVFIDGTIKHNVSNDLLLNAPNMNHIYNVFDPMRYNESFIETVEFLLEDAECPAKAAKFKFNQTYWNEVGISENGTRIKGVGDWDDEWDGYVSASTKTGWNTGKYQWSIQCIKKGLATTDFIGVATNYDKPKLGACLGKSHLGSSLCYGYGAILKGSFKIDTIDCWREGDIIKIIMDLNNYTVCFHKNDEFIGKYELPTENAKYYPVITIFPFGESSDYKLL